MVDAALPPADAPGDAGHLRDARGDHGVLRLVLPRRQRVLLRQTPGTDEQSLSHVCQAEYELQGDRSCNQNCLKYVVGSSVIPVVGKTP